VAHLTASAVITDPSGAQVLLALHAKVGRWLQTGGHVEPTDLDLAAAARREAVEESGLAVEIDPEPLLLSEHPAPCRPDCRHLDVQFRAVAAVEPPRASPESTAVGWFPVGELPDTDDTVRTLVAAARRRAGV
jgi:8-oxo-dGTP pyrophosphatase MutT (NUDIX family)